MVYVRSSGINCVTVDEMSLVFILFDRGFGSCLSAVGHPEERIRLQVHGKSCVCVCVCMCVSVCVCCCVAHLKNILK